MDEADILGDRIGIMNQGKMTVLGSSLFLKRNFGEGYEMSIVKEDGAPSYPIESFLNHNLSKDVILLSEASNELIFKIPKSALPNLNKFFAVFDEETNLLKILNYGMELNTLEKIFLNIGHLVKPEMLIKQKQPEHSQTVMHSVEFENGLRGQKDSENIFSGRK